MSLLNKPVFTDCYQFLKNKARKYLLNQTIALTCKDGNQAILEEELIRLQKVGFSPIGIKTVLAVMAWIIKNENLKIPTEKGKRGRRKRVQLVNLILGMIKPRKEGDQVCISVETKGGVEDITSEIQNLLNHQKPDSLVNTLSQDKIFFRKALIFLKDFVTQTPGVVVEVDFPGQIQVKGPTFCIAETELSDVAHVAVLKEINKHAQLNFRRDKLIEALDSGEICVYPKFTLDNWPSDPLMKHLRSQVSLIVEEEVTRANILCDPQDVRYQTIFRLTTFPLNHLFKNGEELEVYLREIGVYSDWRRILELDPRFIRQFEINQDLVIEICREQLFLIQRRLSQSLLPLEKILVSSGIFAQEGWFINKKKGRIYCIKKNNNGEEVDRVSVVFREIEPQLAILFHADLHYIHTPRATLAYALYLEGDETPFSVLAFDKIDRPYKHDVLLMHGFIPEYCFDLARLYSRPGTPFNTSSAIFSLAFAHLRQNHPEIQAVLSAFMPSHASGVSMISGGLDNPVLIKPCIHYFIERKFDGRTVWEHVTRRRQEREDGKLLESQFPLLPIVELLCQLQNPRFQPLPQIQDKMIFVNV